LLAFARPDLRPCTLAGEGLVAILCSPAVRLSPENTSCFVTTIGTFLADVELARRSRLKSFSLVEILLAVLLVGENLASSPRLSRGATFFLLLRARVPSDAPVLWCFRVCPPFPNGEARSDKRSKCEILISDRNEAHEVRTNLSFFRSSIDFSDEPIAVQSSISEASKPFVLYALDLGLDCSFLTVKQVNYSFC